MAENVKKSISSDSASEGNQFRKEESPLYQPEAGGGAGGAAATTNPGNPKGNEASGNEKKARLIRLIIAIVGLVLAVVALIPSILCSLLWWYWIWVLTVPGLILGICGLVLVFLNKKEAPLVCAGIAIIINLSAIIWGSVEVGLANSYQGPFNVKDTVIRGTSESSGSDPKYKLEEIQVNKTLLPKEKLEKAFYYHVLGRYCEGRAYDWSFRKAQLQELMNCKREQEDWFLEKILLKSDSRYESCSVKHAYKGVDSYSHSPIFKTHEDRLERKEYSNDKLEEEQQKELDKFCKDFDTKEFIEQREKCDEKIEKKLKPKCKPKKGGLLFTEFKMDWEIFKDAATGYPSPTFREPENEEKERKKFTLKYQLEESEKFGNCGKNVRSYLQPDASTSTDKKEAQFRVYEFTKYNFKEKVDPPGMFSDKQMLETTTFEEVFEKMKFFGKEAKEVDGFEVKGTVKCEPKEKSPKQKAVDRAQEKLNSAKEKLNKKKALKEAMEKRKKQSEYEQVKTTLTKKIGNIDIESLNNDVQEKQSELDSTKAKPESDFS